MMASNHPGCERALGIGKRNKCVELELELIQSHMAQKPVLTPREHHNKEGL